MKRIICSVACAAFLVGCGTTGPPRPVAPAATPAAQRSSERDGRIVMRGDVGPDAFGPFTLSGRYRVAFAQRGMGVDFSREVPFTAHLEPTSGTGRVALFERAARTGSTTVTTRGRRRVVVDFGDSPFTLTLTPLGRR